MAIIGVIDSVVLVNLGGTREKAIFTRGQYFSQKINNTLGTYAIEI